MAAAETAATTTTAVVVESAGKPLGVVIHNYKKKRAMGAAVRLHPLSLTNIQTPLPVTHESRTVGNRVFQQRAD